MPAGPEKRIPRSETLPDPPNNSSCSDFCRAVCFFQREEFRCDLCQVFVKRGCHDLLLGKICAQAGRRADLMISKAKFAKEFLMISSPAIV